MDWGTILSITLGSILAIITSFITQLYEEWRDKRNKKKQLFSFLKTELPLCLARIEDFLSYYERTQVPDPSGLVSLEHSAQIFSPYRSTVYLIDKQAARRIIDFYDSLERSIDIIQSMVKLLEFQKHREFALKEINDQIAEICRIHNIGTAILKNFVKLN